MAGVVRCLAAAWLMCGLALADPARAQGQDDLAPLRAELSRLQGQRNYAQAVPIAQRYVELVRQKHGEEHLEFAEATAWLASIYQGQGRLADAEPLYRRSLAIIGKTLGLEHPAVVPRLSNLAELYRVQGRFAEAEPLFKRGLASAERTLGPQHPLVGTLLNNLAMLYHQQGHLAKAEPLFKRSIAIREKVLGPEHPDVATTLFSLAMLYQDYGRPAEAVPVFKRSLAIREKALGPEHFAVGVMLNNLARLYQVQGRLAEAEPLFNRSLAILEKTVGREHPQVAKVLNDLAESREAQGHYREAEPLFQRSLAIVEKALGHEHPHVATALNSLANLYKVQGRYREAEPLYERSLAIREKVLGPEDPYVPRSLIGLADVYSNQGRYADAEPLYKRGLAILEKTLGYNHSGVATALNNLGELYWKQGRYAEAEPLLKRSIAIGEGRDDQRVAAQLLNLGALYWAQGRNAEAEPLLKRSLAILEETLGYEHPGVAKAVNNLAALYHVQGRHSEAEALYKRNLSIGQTAQGWTQIDVAGSLANLGDLYRERGRFADAGPLLERGFSIFETALGPEHPDVATALHHLARLAIDQSDWVRAAGYWRRATAIIRGRTERGLSVAVETSFKDETRGSRSRFEGLVRAIHRMEAGASGPRPVAAEAFEAAQWALGSEVAASLAQMAARSAADSPELASLVRERQDLVSEAQIKDKQLTAAKSQEPAKRDGGAEKSLADRLAAIKVRLGEINEHLVKVFPHYAALASPAPASVAEVQAQLRSDEALVLFLDTAQWGPLPEEAFVWVVTRSDVRWVRSELGTEALNREVAAMRCGLDRALWDNVASAKRCSELVQARRNGGVSAANVLPFDLGRAHGLYKALLGPVEDLIKGKHLLVVPSGALTQLPFQVLVTEPPKAAVPEEVGGYRDAAWLGVRQPITVLPAVSSLKALRAHAKASRAAKVYLGIGNPLLDGRDARDAELARKARASRSCPVGPVPVATRGSRQGGVTPVEIRGGLANVADIRTQTPLPETADELCAVARDLHADVSAVRLGERATEAEIKGLSRSRELARYRVLHFATHGAMAGDLDKDREPGLILTPPNMASAEDDGYLSASEIAGLKLDADWVILSACNTAAGGATNAEALSGLARAFIYAGTRALLVSHWAVYSDATVKLVTKAAAEIAGDAGVGRAEAMRRAMAALIVAGSPIEAHPSYWAPFVVVGEGAAAR
jgi:tetratricopeptide (TPR) repeat protein